MRFIAVLLAGILASGCAVTTNPMLTFHGDRDFNDPFRQCIEDSAGVWRDQTGGVGDINVEWDLNTHNELNKLEHAFSNKIVRLESTSGDGADLESRYAPMNVLGHTRGSVLSTGPIQIGLVVDLIGDDPHDCRLVVTHELGHAFGVHHANSAKEETYFHKTDIMYPMIDSKRTWCLKSNDLTQFCLVNYCSQPVKSCESQPDSLFQ